MQRGWGLLFLYFESQETEPQGGWGLAKVTRKSLAVLGQGLRFSCPRPEFSYPDAPWPALLLPDDSECTS